MNRDTAEAKATELNMELGERGDNRSFYVAVESSGGDWTVEKRTERISWWRRVIDALLKSPGP